VSRSIIHAVAPVRALRGPSPRRLWPATLVALVVLCCAPLSALGASGLRVVSYHGYRVAVPRTWLVYDLARDPAVCVRFNRHAVYLGRPSADQRCPAHAAGRTEAILLEPISAGVASAGGTGAAVSGAGASAGGSGAATIPAAPGADGPSSGSLVNLAHGVVVTATWNGNRDTIRRALGVRLLSALRPSSTAAPPNRATIHPTARLASLSSSIPGGVYTGPGFDACSTPSTSHMSAWGSSSYRAVGVYIGGTNMACAQPNLTPSWVSQESAFGWHVIPIYVGLQAPSNSCGCAAISAGVASSQGAAAARDAVSKAQALGIGQGNPIYFDMEAYGRGGTNSSAVLAFLGAWTTQLHAEGYPSGVYGSDDSGISDLVSRAGAGYAEPDEIWFANWNGVRNTSDPAVPSSEWANHHRLHQYGGGHNETHGGVTINVDGDYVDAPTAAAGSADTAVSVVAASSSPAIYGSLVEGQTLSDGHGNWPGTPTGYAYEWERCSGAGYNCVAIPGATAQSFTLAASDVGHTIRVIEVAIYADGVGIPATSNATGQVRSATPLYWLDTVDGHVFGTVGTSWYGSPSMGGFRGSSIVGMAATADGKGYWLLSGPGRVFAFGNAARLLEPLHKHRFRGIVAAPGGGYWLYTAGGDVSASPGTAWYGAPAANGFHGKSIVGMAATADGRGYWLVSTSGRVFAYGDAAWLGGPRHAQRVRGIVAAPGGGYWVYAANGTVSPSPGTAWYGAPAASGFHGRSIVGMAATADGSGYWLVSAAGRVFAFGDAADPPAPGHGRRIAGITGA
jgi:hypothetical protein